MDLRQAMAMRKRFFTLVLLLTTASWLPSYAADHNDVLQQIERMASLGEKADPSLAESIADNIEKNSTQISKALIPKLKDNKLTEQQQSVYLWALGLAKDQAAMNAIETLHRQSKSEEIQTMCLHALASIGGRQAGNFLLSTLNKTTDEDQRFNILNLLGQMQYEPALPQTEEILKKDMESYWQSIFVFGKMGDKAVPFLLSKINDKDRSIRANALHVVGKWLMAPESAKPMQDQFWKETDVELRLIILGSLEATISELSQMKVFFEQVAAKEKDKQVLEFARETLDMMNKMEVDAKEFAQAKQSATASFQSEYKQLFKSYGKEGDYENLGIYSTLQDEPKLKALRERILQRDSDEAFDDYQQVNAIIMQNRLAHSIQSRKPSNKPTGAGASRSIAATDPDDLLVQGLPLVGTIDKAKAMPLQEIRNIAVPKAIEPFDYTSLLNDGTLYRLEIGKEAVITRIDHIDGTAAAEPLRIPLTAPADRPLKISYGHVDRDVSSVGISIGNDHRGMAWWEEPYPSGRLIEFAIDGNTARMANETYIHDDPHAPAQLRVDITPHRQLGYRFTAGDIHAGEVPHAQIGGRGGFPIAISRRGQTGVEAIIDLPARDIPHLDASEPAPGILNLTLGYITTMRGYVARATWDTGTRKLSTQPLIIFPRAQTVEVADVGAAGVLAVLGLPPEFPEDSHESTDTGLYWIRTDNTILHLLRRVHQLHALALADGFVAVFEEEWSGNGPIVPKDMLVLRAQGDRLGLFRFPRSGPCFLQNMVHRGGNQFLATFCSGDAVAFTVPPIRAEGSR
jgi:HEAT repeat protein